MNVFQILTFEVAIVRKVIKNKVIINYKFDNFWRRYANSYSEKLRKQAIKFLYPRFQKQKEQTFEFLFEI